MKFTFGCTSFLYWMRTLDGWKNPRTAELAELNPHHHVPAETPPTPQTANACLFIPFTQHKHICRACRLTGDRAIKTLNLSANNIGDAGALTLAAILKSNTTLEVLDLSSNVIDYDGITAIAEALTDNNSLKALHIRCT